MLMLPLRQHSILVPKNTVLSALVFLPWFLEVIRILFPCMSVNKIHKGNLLSVEVDSHP